MLASAIGGCSSSSRTAVEGYDEAMLSRKRIMVLTPEPASVVLSDTVAYAASRGVVPASAREQVGIDFRTRLVPAIGRWLDSNTVLHYRDQPVSGIVPIDATADFSGAQPKSWETIRRAGREGNVDFMIVLNGTRLTSSADSPGSGTEAIETNYSLIDAQAGKVMTSGNVSIPAGPASAAVSYEELAKALTAKLPFHVTTGTAR